MEGLNTKQNQTSLDLRPEEDQMKDLRARIIGARNSGVDINSFIDSLTPAEKLLLAKIQEEDRVGDQPDFRGH